MSEPLEIPKESEEATDSKKIIEDSRLEKLAIEEILREATRGALRAEAVGPSGWLKSQQPTTNKIFLKNTIRHAISSNNYRFDRISRRDPRRSLKKEIDDKQKKKDRRAEPYRRK